MSIRHSLFLLFLTAACADTTTSGATSRPDRDMAAAGASAERARGEPAEETDGPREAYEWRRLRWMDENGNVDPLGRRRALAERAANVAWSATIDVGGIGPFGWREIGPNNLGGRTRSLVIHPTAPSTMWAGSVGGGVWRSDNGGLSWTPQADRMGNLAIGCLALDPTNPSVLYAGTGEGYGNQDAIAGEGIWKTIDGGANWTQLLNTTGFGNTNRIAVSPANPALVLASSTGGIRRSLDGGVSWSTVRSATKSYQVLFDPVNGNNCVAHVLDSTTHRVVYSTNAGASWTNATTANLGAAATRIELCYAAHDPGWVYACIGTGAGEIWRSTDGGANWTQRSAAATASTSQWWYDDAIWVDPTDSTRVVVGAIYVWRSTDGGATFTQVSNGYLLTNQPHPDVHFFANHPGYNGSTNRQFYVCSDGAVHYTADILTATTTTGWVHRDQSYRTLLYYGAAGDGATGKICGGTQDNGHLTINSATTMNAILTYGGDGGFAAMDPTNANYLYGEYVYLQLHRSSNGGTSASNIYSGISDAGNGSTANFIAPFILDPNNVNRMLAGGQNLWRSNNVKSTPPAWAAIKAGVGTNVSAIAVAPGNPDVIWVGYNNGRLERTANGTAVAPIWTVIDDNGATNPLPNRYVGRILIDGTSGGSTVFVGFGGFAGDNLWRTTNGGATFTDVTGAGVSGLPSAPVYGIAKHPSLSGHFYVATEVGVFGTSDNCATWSTSNDGPADVSVDEVNFLNNSSVLLAATHGRGLWTSAIWEPSVAVLGSGCPGSAGTPTLSATPPRLGQATTITGTNLVPGQVEWLVQGWSNTSWFGNPLPFDLLPFGAPGCFLRCSVDGVLYVTSTAAGTISTSLLIPSTPGMLGARFYLEMSPADAAANSFGRTVTNALTCVIGN